jgi:alkylation response protein AidB-like acyl-CoA dehydrogenase
VSAHPPGEEIARWRARARALADGSVAPRREAMERAEAIDPELRRELGAAGFLGLTVPTEFGGSGATTRALVAVLEELGRGSAAVATLLSVHLSVAAAPIATWGTAEQRQRYLPRLATGEWLGAFALTEPSVGSDAAHLSTRYRPDGEGFRLDGAKMFITNGGLADVLLTFATRDPALGARGVSAFLVERGAPGFAVAGKLAKLGLRASETNELLYDGLRLPAAARLGPEGEGLAVALRALTEGRVGIAACALGVARAAYEELLALGRSDPSDGARSALARAYTELTAAAALVERAAASKDEGRPFVDEASAAKLFASETAVRLAHLAVERSGPAGGLDRARPAQLLRDARVFPIVEGTTEIQELILGREILGR